MSRFDLYVSNVNVLALHWLLLKMQFQTIINTSSLFLDLSKILSIERQI